MSQLSLFLNYFCQAIGILAYFYPYQQHCTVGQFSIIIVVVIILTLLTGYGNGGLSAVFNADLKLDMWL